MPEGEDFYISPIPLGYYRYIDLLEGPLSIEHIAEIHDAMAYSAENQRRISDTVNKK